MDDGDLRALLLGVHTVAVVGIKTGETDDAHRVPAYLQARGYRVLPVNPKLESALGEKAAAALSELAEPVDLVNVFRAPQFLPGHVDEILALSPRPRAVWLQRGIRHDEAAARLEEAGIRVVQDRCIMVDHGRLLGSA